MNKAIFFSTNVLSEVAASAAIAANAHPNQNLVATLFSAAWLEAALNELIHGLISTQESELDQSLMEARRAAIAANLFDSHSASVELKLRVLCATVSRQQLDFGKQPWQRVTLLLALRNWLVHLRPELMDVRHGAEEEPSSIVSRDVHKLVNALRDTGAITVVPPGRLVPVAIAAALPGVGRWSYATTYDSLAAVAEWHPKWKRRLLFASKKPADL